MERKLPRKASEMSVQELYSHFRESIISLTKVHFDGPQVSALEPAFFIGIRKEALKKKLDEFKDKLDPETYKRMEEDVSSDKDYSIHTMFIPLGTYMKDYGVDFVNHVAKDAGVKEINAAIESMRAVDYNSVMFTCFVSESMMSMINVEKLDSETAKDLQFKRKNPHDIFTPEFIEKHCEMKDVVTLMFETMNTSQVVAFDILRGESYQEMINENIMPESTIPSGGIFAGFLHKGVHTNAN